MIGERELELLLKSAKQNSEVEIVEEIYIVDAARSPIGKFLGSLAGEPATSLGAHVVRGLIGRSGISPRSVEELIVGNVISAGQGQNIAKQVVMKSGLAPETPAYLVNMVCASSLKAAGLAYDSIRSGDAKVIIAGGIESMSNAPFALHGVRQFHKYGDVDIKSLLDRALENGVGPEKFELVDEMLSEGLLDCYSGLHMGSIAESIGKDYNISRSEQDEFALQSHRKAALAQDLGKFDREIIPIDTGNGKMVRLDEGIRRDTSMEKLAALKPVFDSSGTITAGNASQLSDGASFLIIASESAAGKLGLRPIAKIDSYASSGSLPESYGLAPVQATQKALLKAGVGLDNIDLIEINEAFCVQTLGVVKALGIDIKKLNVNGGATALGHPLGATGACILSTLIYAMLDRKKDTGMATLCHGGGGAVSMVVSRV